MEIFTSDRARSRGFGGGGGNFDDRFLRSQNMEIEIMKRGGLKLEITHGEWRMWWYVEIIEIIFNYSVTFFALPRRGKLDRERE